MDPDPNADLAVMSGDPGSDHTDYVAEYEPGLDPSAGVARPVDAVPDEEFFET